MSLEHKTTALQLESIAAIFQRPLAEGIMGQLDPEAQNHISKSLLGLADWHRASAADQTATPDCLLQRLADYLQGMIDDIQESGSDHQEESSLLAEIDQHFANIFEVKAPDPQPSKKPQPTPEPMPEKQQEKDPLINQRVTILRTPYNGHDAIITGTNHSGTVNCTLAGTTIEIKDLKPGKDIGIKPLEKSA